MSLRRDVKRNLLITLDLKAGKFTRAAYDETPLGAQTRVEKVEL